MLDKGEGASGSQEPILPEQPPVKEKVEITQEYLDYLREIARSVSGDQRMGFELGKAGEGSKAFLFDAENRKIVIDPEHIQNKEGGIFVLAHEAAHVFMTIGPKELGLSPQKANQLFSQVGLGFTSNAIEDCAISELQKVKYPNLEPLIKANYDKEFENENATLYATQTGSVEEFLVKDFYFKNGYLPRFIQYGSEVMRDWYVQSFSQESEKPEYGFSKKLDEAVQKALKKTVKDARKSVAQIPGPELTTKDRKKIIGFAQKRFKIVVEKIWPEVKKLVEMDLHTEELRQMVNELMNALRELVQQQQKKQQAQERGDTQIEKEADEKLQQAEENLKDLGGGLSDEAVKEIMDLAKALTEEMAKQDESLQPDQEQLSEQAEEEKSDETEKVEELPQPVDLPLPENQLSEKTKKELEEKFKNLSGQKKKELRQKAEQKVKDFEDSVNEQKEGQLNKDRPQSHFEQEENIKKQEQEEEKKKPTEEEKKEKEEDRKRRGKIEEDLRKKLRESMPRYQKIVEEIAQPRDELYERLRHILRPDEYSGLESGHPSGKILNVARAMQSERDPEQLGKMWDRKLEFEETDNRIISVVDLSGSMEGEPANEAEKGMLMATTALDKLQDIDPSTLRVRNGVIGYNRSAFDFKKMDERLDDAIQQKLSTIPDKVGGGTDTYAGIEKALQEINQDLGKTGNYILNFTDGQTNDATVLQKLLINSKKERKTKKIKIGLVWIGQNITQAHLKEMVEFYGYDFGLVMPATKLSDAQKQAGEKDFANALADLLEDIVKNPDAY